MKSYLNCLLLTSLLIISLNSVLFSQNEETKKSDDDWKSGEYIEKSKHKYLKEVYDLTLDFPFEEVYKTVISCIEENHCLIMSKSTRQNDAGLYLGNIKSDYCVLAAGDTAYSELKFYSIDLPFIRGGDWTTGRMQYKFKLTEQEDGKVYVKLDGELSGHETLVTKKVHFWKSNGYLETMMLEKIKSKLEGKSN